MPGIISRSSGTLVCGGLTTEGSASHSEKILGPWSVHLLLERDCHKPRLCRHQLMSMVTQGGTSALHPTPYLSI